MQNSKVKYQLIGVCCLLLSLGLLNSCAGLRHLDKNESLYTGMRLKVKKSDSTEHFKIEKNAKKLSEAYLTVWDSPNGAVFGTPFVRIWSTRLWLYNVFRTEKDHGFNRWMQENFGEPPILISDIQPELKCRKLEEVYENHGHFGTKAYYISKTKRKGKKTKIKYYVIVTPSYHYKLIEGDSNNLAISKDINAVRREKSWIHEGDEFNLEFLKNERKDIWESLQNQGYYYISPEHIKIEADTTVGRREINLQIRIDSTINKLYLQKVRISDVKTFIDSVMIDTTNGEFHYNETGRYNYNFLNDLTRIESNSNFSRRKTILTSQLLNQAAIFNRYSIKYEIDPQDSLKLHGLIYLRSKNATQLKANLNANFKTIGYVGPSIKFSLNQYNMAGKGRNLNSFINLYYDYPVGHENERVSPSYGFNWSNKLTYLAKDGFLNKKARDSYLPEYFWQQSIDFKNRIDLFRQLSLSGTYGIKWNQSDIVYHELKLLNLTLFDLLSTTPLYDSIASVNDRVRTSLNNQLIVSSEYSFTLDKRKNPKWPRGYYLNTSIEVAGNALNFINSAFKESSPESFSIFGAKVVQFTNLQYDFRAFIPLGSRNTFAFRHTAGYGFAYGNSKVMPYSRQYYIGGSTSMRPFSARTFGPGTYIGFDIGEVNKMGDLKIESNFEYRLKFGRLISTALWVDYGNIWLLNVNPEKPNAEIQWNSFFKDQFINGGIGLRLDLNFIMLRADLGTTLYFPIFPENFRWIWQNKFLYVAPSIGFGFPF